MINYIEYIIIEFLLLKCYYIFGSLYIFFVIIDFINLCIMYVVCVNLVCMIFWIIFYIDYSILVYYFVLGLLE